MCRMERIGTQRQQKQRCVGDEERAVETMKRSAEELHEVHPELNAKQIMSRVTNVHNERDRINTVLSSGHSHTADQCGRRKPKSPLTCHGGTTLEITEQMQQMCTCRPVLIDESWNSNEVETEDTLNFISASLCTCGGFQRARNNLERKLDQHEFLQTNEKLMDESVELSGLCTTRLCAESISDRR